jgi:hypothetical protein
MKRKVSNADLFSDFAVLGNAKFSPQHAAFLGQQYRT